MEWVDPAGTDDRQPGVLAAYATIRKDRDALQPRPNLYDYAAERAAFTWERARSWTDCPARRA